MKNTNDLSRDLDANFIRACLEKMDVDVATRFILSGLSLSKVRIEEAFSIACKEMQYRTEEKMKKENISPTSHENPATQDEFAKSIAKILEDILLPPKNTK